MNKEHYADPTADLAIGRCYAEWKREQRRKSRWHEGSATTTSHLNSLQSGGEKAEEQMPNSTKKEKR